MLLDPLTGDDVEPLLERGDGRTSPALGADVCFAPFAAWPAAEREAVSLTSGRVLDVGCGAGRHALHLQERGCRVVAIDISPGAVETARRRGVRDVRLLAAEDVDERLGRFDAILMMCGNFGLSGSLDGAAALLHRLERVAAPNAALLADCVDGPHVTLRLRYRDLATPWFSWLNLSREQLRDLVDETPWRLDRMIDYDDDPSAYVTVLRAPS